MRTHESTEGVFHYASVNPEEQIASFLPESSKTIDAPEFLIIAGAIATGKSQARRKYYSATHATIDAGDIFLSLCCNRPFDFPSKIFEKEVELIGREVTRRAFAERRRIVCEMSMIPYEDFAPLVQAIGSRGYSVGIRWVDCDMETAFHRNAHRRKDSISSYYTDQFHIRWLSEF